MWMSWKHQESDFSSPFTYEQKVDVFYEQTLGWQLHIADLIANGGSAFGQINTGEPGYQVPSIRHSGFAVLHICLSYFELVGSMLSSKTGSTERFKHGVRDILPGIFKGTPEDDALLIRLYKGARCGLYHAGRTGHSVGLGQPADGSPVAYDSKSDTAIVNPHRLPAELKTHLVKLKARLLDPLNIDLRRQFEKRFDKGFE